MGFLSVAVPEAISSSPARRGRQRVRAARG
jgi:hypothetical protein